MNKDSLSCNINDLILIKEGKNNNKIAYCENGKIILFKNKIKCGFAKIDNIISEKDNYVLVKAHNEINDYYYGINVEEFKKALTLNSFTIGYEYEFNYKGRKECQIFAYKKENGIIIIADSFDNKTCFNSIDVYVPNLNCMNIENNILYMGSSKISVFNLCHDISNRNLWLRYFSNYKTNPIWPENETPSFWNYSDNCNEENNFINEKYKNIKSSELWKNTVDRIFLLNENNLNEVKIFLNGSNIMKEVFYINKIKRYIYE